MLTPNEKFKAWLEGESGLDADERSALQSNQLMYNLVKRAFFAQEKQEEARLAKVEKQLAEDAKLDEAWEKADYSIDEDEKEQKDERPNEF